MRRKVLNSDGNLLLFIILGSGLLITPDDFYVGKHINIYGKDIMIVDCDEYTREFYANLGLD